MKTCTLETCHNKTTNKYCSRACASKAYRLRKKQKAQPKMKPVKIEKGYNGATPSSVTSTFFASTYETKEVPPEACYLDECNKPGAENIIINHPDLNKLQLTLRVLLCKDHRYLLREVA